MSNINPATGIAYGYISANALHPEVVDKLQQGVNVEYERALRNHLESAEAAAREAGELQDDEEFNPDAATDQFNERWEDYEPVHTGTHEGVRYGTSWLGGALNVWIFESPFTTDKARRASPCVPGAAILDTLDGTESGYDVPPDWRAEQ